MIRKNRIDIDDVLVDVAATCTFSEYSLRRRDPSEARRGRVACTLHGRSSRVRDLRS